MEEKNHTKASNFVKLMTIYQHANNVHSHPIAMATADNVNNNEKIEQYFI